MRRSICVSALAALALAPQAAAHAGESDRPGFYPLVNLSMTLGATWGDSGYATPLEGAFAFGLRGELSFSLRRPGWGLGIYGEIGEPGSLFESRWLGGGGINLLSPRLWYLGAALSAGFYGRESRENAYPGFTTGLSLGLRPRAFVWDFLLAFRVDLRQAIGRDEQSVTIGAHLDLAAAVALVALALKGSARLR